MAIEIISRGTLPENDVFDVACRKCGSQLRFLRSDAKLTSDQRDTVTVSAKRSVRPLP